MTDQPEKKIIIDEDWKTQVQREREELQAPEAPKSTSQPSADSQSATQSEPTDFDPEQLPPASLNMLVTTMATQAMAAMGQLPDPMSGQPEVNLPFAQYHIDLLAVLQQKTCGNVTEDEALMLEGALHQLRMTYVQLSSTES